jgi:CBS domain-containing protein
MTVARILAAKGRHVTTVEPHATLRDVVDILAQKHIGAIVITDSTGRMLGIVSERDVVRALAKAGPDALDEAVSRYMTREVITASESDGVLEVAQKMSRGRFRHMPVLSEGRIVGIISTGDAIKYRLEQMERDQNALREYIATA